MVPGYQFGTVEPTGTDLFAEVDLRDAPSWCVNIAAPVSTQAAFATGQNYTVSAFVSLFPISGGEQVGDAITSETLTATMTSTAGSSTNAVTLTPTLVARVSRGLYLASVRVSFSDPAPASLTVGVGAVAVTAVTCVE